MSRCSFIHFFREWDKQKESSWCGSGVLLVQFSSANMERRDESRASLLQITIHRIYDEWKLQRLSSWPLQTCGAALLSAEGVCLLQCSLNKSYLLCRARLGERVSLCFRAFSLWGSGSCMYRYWRSQTRNIQFIQSGGQLVTLLLILKDLCWPQGHTSVSSFFCTKTRWSV